MSRTVAERLFENYAAEHHAELFQQLTRCEDGYLHEPTGLALLTRTVDIAERYAIEAMGGRHFNLCRHDGAHEAEQYFAALAGAILDLEEERTL